MNGVSAHGGPVRIVGIAGIGLSLLLIAATPTTTSRPTTRTALKLPALGDHLEVKWGGSWLPATVKNKSPKGWILIQYDRDKFFEWVEPWRTRKPGSDIDVPWASSNHALFKPEPPPANPPTLTPPEEHRATQRRADASRDADDAAPATKRAAAAADEKAPPEPAPFDPPVTKPIGTARQLTLLADAPAWKLVPDSPAPTTKPTNKHIELKGGSREFFESPQLILPRGGTGPIALVNYIDAPPNKNFATVRCERVNLITGVSFGVMLMPAPSEPLDLSPSGKSLLSRAYSKEPGKRDHLDLWSLGPSAATPPKHQLSFKPYDSKDWPRRDPEWAAFVDDQHLLTINSESVLIHWDLTGPVPKSMWQVSLSRHGAIPTFSPTRKYLAAFDPKGLVFLDPLTGTLLARLPEPGVFGGDIAFRDDGKQLATLADGHAIHIWDLATGNLHREVTIPRGAAGAPIAFVADNSLLLGTGGHLLDLDRRIILWRYEIPYYDPPASGQWAGRYWQYIAPDKSDSPLLASAALPHEEAIQLASTLKADDLLLIKPGVTVSLEVNIEATEEQRKQVIDSLKSKLQKNQITVADAPQPIKLIASTSLGESKQQEYRQFSTGEKQQVTITPHKTRLAFETADGKIAWEWITSSGAGMMLTPKPGESAQSAADASAQYNIPFLINSPIPQFIAKPREPAEIGRSKITARGVESTDVFTHRPVRPSRRR